MFLFIGKMWILQIICFVYSNTSHVLIYPDILIGADAEAFHSNTSHVLIYRVATWLGLYSFAIQIHLMFLFIGFLQP